MTSPDHGWASRRKFLEFVFGSPLMAALATPAGRAGEAATTAQSESVARVIQDLITSADEAINVFDFEAVARAKLPPAHYGYLATGVDDDLTVSANRQAFSRLYLRPRRLVDVTHIDISTRCLGETWETPIVLAPVGSHKAYHREGEIAVAKAARARNHLQILSSVSTTAVEEVAAARGAPVWFQLYPTDRWDVTRGLVKRAQAAGCPVVVVTTDLVTDEGRETLERFKRRDTLDCTDCHTPGLEGYVRRKPMFNGLNVSGLASLSAKGMTWTAVKRLKQETAMKVVLKGIVTREDAALCLQHGVDGIIVSNHGGRAEESGRGTLDSLPEVIEAVRGKLPVLVDGGFRRGTDIFKALALGAKAICIGRPYMWGLAAFGQAGVERVLSLLRLELQICMQRMGTRSLAEINRNYIGKV